MSRSRSSRGRRRGGHGGGEESSERWLLTYADMITLLMALFMVLFSISSVNISKLQVLQLALKAAFSGEVLPGGKSIAQPGATPSSTRAPSATDAQAIVPPSPSSSPLSENASSSQASATARQLTSQQAAAQQAEAAQEAAQFAAIKQRLDAYAAKHGFSSQVQTSVEKRGLVIRVLTDRLLFASGQATLIPQALPLLREIGSLVNLDSAHPIAVEGNTDDVPIQSAAFPSNWELSTARASMVVRDLISTGVGAQRMSAAGYADLRPIASNTTPRGRAENRRVEIVLQRLGEGPSPP